VSRLVRTPQSSFTSGELDPSMAARIDTTRYYAGAQTLRNVLVVPQGGLRRRPGMRHVATVPGAMAGLRLIPFAFNTEQTYCLALTAGEFRVFRSDGALLAVVTGCPWNAPQAARMNWAQSADTLLLAHPDVPPQRIRRGTDETAWTRDDMPMSNLPTHDYGGGGEPVISPTRGWPECLTFHQGRLWMAGFRSRPASFIASRVGLFFDFFLGSALDDEGIYGTIDTDQVNAIHQVASGRTLQFFTAGAEHAVLVEPPITARNIAVQEQSRRGIRRWTRLTEVDGAVIFAQRGGRALRQFLYNEVEAAYVSDLLSLLAPHLIRLSGPDEDAAPSAQHRPADVAARKSASNDDADHVILCNADGEASVLTTLRAQEVTAFSRWQTDGAIRGVACLLSGQVFFAVERAGSVRIEDWTEQARLDASVLAGSATPFTTVAGLDHLEGREVAMLADDSFQGTATVASGQVTLPRPARTAEVGLPFVPEVRTMPLEPRDPSGNLIGRRCRPVRMTARVQGSTSFHVNGRPVVFRTLGGPPAPALDSPPPRFTGDVTVDGLLGWRTRHALTLTQPVPGSFHLLGLSTQIAVGE